MRIRKDKNGYVLWLPARDTYDWAHRPDASWPCSTLSGNRVMVVVDSNGLCDLTSNGHGADDIDGHELEAIVADHLPADLRRLWPVWARPF